MNKNSITLTCKACDQRFSETGEIGIFFAQGKERLIKYKAYRQLATHVKAEHPELFTKKVQKSLNGLLFKALGSYLFEGLVKIPMFLILLPLWILHKSLELLFDLIGDLW